MAQVHRKRLGDALVERRLVTPDQLTDGLKRHRITGERLGEALVCLGHVSRCDLWVILGAPWVTLESVQIDPDCVKLFPRALLRKWQAVPVQLAADGTLLVAMADPLNLVHTDEMWRTCRLTIRACAAAPSEIAKLLARLDRLAETIATPVETSGFPRPSDLGATRAADRRACEFCGRAVEPGEGGVVSSSGLSGAWCLAVELEGVSHLSRHSIMADWMARGGESRRICSACQTRLLEAERHRCSTCGRPTHIGEGSVIVELGRAKLTAVRDEMEMRRRKCLTCGREVCLRCALRHGTASGAESPLCPTCSEPAESPAAVAG